MGIPNDLRFAARSLRRRPGFTLAAAGTLALGIGATTAIFGVANAVLLRSLPYPDAHELTMVWGDDRDEPAPLPGGAMSSPDFGDVQTETETLEAIALYDAGNHTLSSDGSAEVIRGARATRDLFRVFASEPVLGRTFTEEETRFQGPDAVVVSDAFWQSRLGGDPAALGTTLTINGEPHPIVGVAPPAFAFPADAQLWLPLQNNDEGCGRGCGIASAVARLADDVPIDRARAELDQLSALMETENADSNEDLVYRVTPLRDVIVGDVRTSLWVLLGAVGMVLLIACANVANLVLLRGGSRRTELAVRTALGAGRRRLLAQLMTENAALALLGGVGGVLLASWATSGVVRLAPEGLPRLDEIGLDATTAIFAVAIVGLTVLVFGLVPALRISSGGVAESIRRDGGVGDRAGGRTRAVVLVAEVALSVMLLLGAGLMLRSLARMQTVDLGLTTEDVSVFRLSLPGSRYDGPDARVAFVDRLEERLSAIPGVEGVATGVSLPFGDLSLGGTFLRPDLPEPEPGQAPNPGYRTLDPDAFDVLGLEIVRGRPLLESDRRGARPVALINEAAAERYWPGEDPLGKTMRVLIALGYDETEPRTVVGIVRDFRSEVTRPARPEMYMPRAQTGAGFPHVAIRAPGRPSSEVLAAAREAVSALDPELPIVSPAALDDLVAEHMAAPRFYLVLLSLFAIMAVVLAAVGIYGVVAYMVVQRTPEIGVRVALGARVDHVIRMVVWQGLGPALAGLALGLAGALALGRLISGILFDVAPTDPLTWGLASLLLLGVVAGAAALPARKASRIDPAEALRTE
ncbi:MAG: ABC transporter permease [Gemmatimonadota bacterium]|nr:ABC transporter permease [Gemmatimonadota bacterium]